MAFELPDPATEPGARVARRLAADMIAWLTLTDRVGTPFSVPLLFQPERIRSTRSDHEPQDSSAAEGKGGIGAGS